VHTPVRMASLLMEAFGSGTTGIRPAPDRVSTRLDYMRFEYDVTASHDIAEGEEVRWFPRHTASGLLLPAEDCWVFDG
jgi:hypothetical protein